MIRPSDQYALDCIKAIKEYELETKKMLAALTGKEPKPTDEFREGLFSDCCRADFDPFGFSRSDGLWQEKCLKCGKECEPIWYKEGATRVPADKKKKSDCTVVDGAGDKAPSSEPSDKSGQLRLSEKEYWWGGVKISKLEKEFKKQFSEVTAMWRSGVGHPETHATKYEIPEQTRDLIWNWILSHAREIRDL